MKFLGYVGIVTVVLLYACAVFALLFKAIDECTEERPWIRWACAAFAGFALGFAGIAYMVDGNDPYANTLCMNGHQEWVTRWTGKSQTTEKHWVCTQWEAK